MTVEWTLKTAPTIEPLSIEEAKAHGNLTHDPDAVLMERLIRAARMWVENYTGRSLLTQTWQLSAPEFYQRLWLPRAAPLASVTFVKYYDANNALQTLASTVYSVAAFSEPAFVELAVDQSWPSVALRSDAVQIEYVTGSTTVAAIPTPLVQAVALLVAHWYENREASITGVVQHDTRFAVEALCSEYRVFSRTPWCYV